MVSFVKSNYGIYTQELLGNEKKAQDIANLNVSYVIYYYYGLGDVKRANLAKRDFENLGKYNIKIILMPGGQNTDTNLITSVCTLFNDVENLIGWYCFDDLSFHKDITIDKQNAVINKMKRV